ncbi:hypothetical protein [Streptomyces iconiensis]|uniref:Uncharacterized protein n=1 Tax=Streptomyces iconiensis TaxID=1384038 RepID=A0ABT6ZTP6_9ACTN|nr:hypothetical protein [Streptomyces iconiensis]MDJ1132440.1 hypothetical protein [Streptomyces iconiensis]
MKARDAHEVLYDALVAFQETAHLSSLQHAQVRQHLAEHLAEALHAAGFAQAAVVRRESAAEIERLTTLAHRLTERLAEAQDASEGRDRDDQARTGGARLDKLRPYGRLTARCFPDPARRAAWRLLQDDAVMGGESA